MFPPAQLTGQGLSPACAPWVPPSLSGNNPVMAPTFSRSTPPGPCSGALWRPPQCHQIQRVQLAVEQRRTEVPGIGDKPLDQQSPMTNRIQIMRNKACWTWVLKQVKPLLL